MKRRVFYLIVVIALASAFASSSFAQTNTPQLQNVPIKFDEYGLIRGCDHSARLDNFAIQLQNTLGSKAYIFVYGPDGSSQPIMEIAKDYLVNSRGITADLIKTVYAGRNDVLSEPRVQLWIVPPGASRPNPAKFEPNVETFQGLFSENKAWDPNIFEVDEEESEESKSVPVVDDQGTGPSMRDVTHASLADVLKHQKTAIAYIIAYNGEDASPGAWRRVAQAQLLSLTESGAEANRLKIVYGAARKRRQFSYGLLTPIRRFLYRMLALSNLQKRRLRWIIQRSRSWLQRSSAESFKRLAESLRRFPLLVGCAVVRFGTYQEPIEETEPQTTPSEEIPAEAPADGSPEINTAPEPEPADVAKLIEKWKNELAEKHNIPANRFVVLFNYSDGYASNMLETYVVPPGAALPNPDVEEADEEKMASVPAAQATPPPSPNDGASIKADSTKPVLIGKSF